MASSEKKPRVRHSVRELQTMYENGNKAPLEKLMKAWKGIKALPPTDPNSFFVIGGYHGEPFVGAGWGNSQYWGGFCNHGNVLFPTWHRVYLVRLEEALQSIDGCEDVMMAYWDETSEESLKDGIPWALTDEFFPRDSKEPNPLRSFVFPLNIKDNISGDNPNYSKPEGYETVRYPLSGLVGTEQDRENTAKHNAQFPDYKENVALLNQNVKDWLGANIIIDGKPVKTGVEKKYEDCLHAPNYTVFSNTTSAAEWNTNNKGTPIVPLESPHNSIHLAVGGYDAPGYDRSPISGANGDMGENDTAGLDPIFFFHHCNVDRMFWLWQKFNGYTDKLDIIENYPGTNSVDSQGPTPGTAPNSWLSLDSPLDPFKKKEKGRERPYTSQDCINIEKQLDFTYSKGSLDDEKAFKTQKTALKKANPEVIEISNVNRAGVNGSFLIEAQTIINGKPHVIGHEAVLSRWHVGGCANCQTHLEVKAHFTIPKATEPKKSIVNQFLAILPKKEQHVVQAEVITRKNNRGRQPMAKVTLR